MLAFDTRCQAPPARRAAQHAPLGHTPALLVRARADASAGPVVTGMKRWCSAVWPCAQAQTRCVPRGHVAIVARRPHVAVRWGRADGCCSAQRSGSVPSLAPRLHTDMPDAPPGAISASNCTACPPGTYSNTSGVCDAGSACASACWPAVPLHTSILCTCLSRRLTDEKGRL